MLIGSPVEEAKKFLTSCLTFGVYYTFTRGTWKRTRTGAFALSSCTEVPLLSGPAPPRGRVRKEACGVSFNVPRSLKAPKGVLGTDSCFVELADRKLRLTLDYGWYNRPYGSGDSRRRRALLRGDTAVV